VTAYRLLINGDPVELDVPGFESARGARAVRLERDGDRIARVLALVVDPAERGRGLGHQLMAEAERIAGATGCTFIEVTSGHHRPEARQLYESLGYDPSVTSYLRKRL